MNIAAFRCGRRAAIDPAALEALIAPRPAQRTTRCELSQSFDEIGRRAASPSSPPIRARAMRGATSRGSTRSSRPRREKAPGQTALAEAVARYLFKLMAYKDEYEVARLYTDTSFVERVKSQFAGDNLRFEFHLAPPLLGQHDPATGEPKKMSFGPWMLKAFGVLAQVQVPARHAARSVRLHARTPHRAQADRGLRCAAGPRSWRTLTPANYPTAVALAALPEKIRGFGPIKERTIKSRSEAEEQSLTEQFRSGASPFLKAAE